jgi:hypothetical protein
MISTRRWLSVTAGSTVRFPMTSLMRSSTIWHAASPRSTARPSPMQSASSIATGCPTRQNSSHPAGIYAVDRMGWGAGPAREARRTRNWPKRRFRIAARPSPWALGRRTAAKRHLLDLSIHELDTPVHRGAQSRCLLMAHSANSLRCAHCPVAEVERTLTRGGESDANDPKRI